MADKKSRANWMLGNLYKDLRQAQRDSRYDRLKRQDAIDVLFDAQAKIVTIIQELIVEEEK